MYVMSMSTFSTQEGKNKVHKDLALDKENNITVAV